MSAIFRVAFISVVIGFLIAPILVIGGVSLNQQKRLLFPPQGLSLKWYGELFVQSDWLNALLNSVIIAISSGIIAVSIALPLALYVWSRKTVWSNLLFGLGLAPFMLPPVISALGMMVFWISAGLYGHMISTIISHGIFLLTLPLVTISLGLNSINRELIEVAWVMGARNRVVFFTVISPLIRPYIISGFCFAVVLSLNEYIIAYMVAGFTVETLPIKFFNSLRYGYTPVMASATLLFVLIATVVFGCIALYGDLPKLLGSQNRTKDDV